MGKAENDGSEGRTVLSARHYEEEAEDVPSSGVRWERVRATPRRNRRGAAFTVYELLFGRLCANSDCVCEEVSLVPAGLGGLE